jgi:lysosomal acid lipase/cholesteryl ester hydrolase
LADAGYDVWLNNSRGNEFSQGHETRRNSLDFWDYSFDSMADNDLPAVVDYVLGESGREELNYVGHS